MIIALKAYNEFVTTKILRNVGVLNEFGLSCAELKLYQKVLLY